MFCFTVALSIFGVDKKVICVDIFCDFFMQNSRHHVHYQIEVKTVICQQHGLVIMCMIFDWHNLGSNSAEVKLLCSWKRQFATILPGWAVFASASYSISIKNRPKNIDQAAIFWYLRKQVGVIDALSIVSPNCFCASQRGQQRIILLYGCLSNVAKFMFCGMWFQVYLTQ